MPCIWPYYLGNHEREDDERDTAPGVNQGRKRGITKSARRRRKR